MFSKFFSILKNHPRPICADCISFHFFFCFFEMQQNPKNPNNPNQDQTQNPNQTNQTPSSTPKLAHYKNPNAKSASNTQNIRANPNLITRSNPNSPPNPNSRPSPAPYPFASIESDVLSILNEKPKPTRYRPLIGLFSSRSAPGLSYIFSNEYGQKLVEGGAISVAITLFIAPIERAKLILQLQDVSSQLPPEKYYKNISEIFFRSTKELGACSLWYVPHTY